MNCPICGAVLNDGAKFCGNCGNKVEAAAPVTETPVMPAAPVTPVMETPVMPAAPVTPVMETPVMPAAEPSIFDQPVQTAYAQPEQQIGRAHV